jgi:tRNA 2-thiouridine synthesizing protein E
MTVTAIAGKEVHVDDEGFLTEYDEWDEELAAELAKNIGIDELTEGHLKVIAFLRDDYAEQGETATLRRVQTVGGIPTKELFVLFPKKPAKKMSYVAGLPKPVGCI